MTFKTLIAGLFLATSAQADSLDCLAKNVYFEAGNQSLLGKYAVAWVTLNRVDHDFYPDKICEVVWQPDQFAWTNDGKSDTPSQNALEQAQWEISKVVAKIAYDNWKSGEQCPFGTPVMFHADYVSPQWRYSYNQLVQIDDHIFYGENS